MPDENSNPLDAVLDLIVFAPLGLALTARENLPKLIARGRQEWASQSAMAKVMGEYAVGEAEKRARKRIDEVTETLSGLGVFPSGQPPQAPPGASSAATSSSASEPTAEPASTNGKAPPVAARSKAELAIPGYDTLSASQVVQRLAGLSASELEAVRDYEAETRGRRTILSKIAQLQSSGAEQ